MDINFYSLILAVISFVIGTLVPIFYRRFSYEGLSIQQPFPVDILISVESDEKNHISHHVFVTVVKIANSQKDSALIDDIQLDLPTKVNFDTHLTEIKIKILSPEDLIYAPIDLQVQVVTGKEKAVEKEYIFPDGESYVVLSQPTSFSYLPFIVKGNEELLMAIQFSLPKSVITDLIDQNRNSNKQLKKLKFRVNGKYRTYGVYVRTSSLTDS